MSAPDDSRYRQLFERSADAILIIDGDTFVDCNRATVEMLRYRNRRELLQTHPSHLSPEFQPDGRRSFDKANEMMDIAFEQGSHRFEWNHKRADETVFPVEVLLTAVPQDGRNVLHVVWRDITERKQLESELRQKQKMEAVGRLTGGIAHDFNNLLMAMIGYTELLELELPGESPAHEYLHEIRLAGKRASRLVRQLLAFSRKQVLQPEVIELNDLVANLEKLLVRVLGEDIVIDCRTAEEPLPVFADPNQIEQVIVNLATNARDALAPGGLLELRTKRAEMDGQPAALIEMSDSGAGIDPAVLPRIFEPFFTTKPVDRGTGLGLATAHGIVKQSGGNIEVESEPGRGSTFRVYLPLSKLSVVPETGDGSTRDEDPEPIAASILVVEDEEAVARIYETVLRRAGFEIHAAPNGRVALRMVEDLELRPDLLLTDVIMPEMDGMRLAKVLREAFPAIKVLFASGYADDALAHRGLLQDGVELIEKPFAPHELVDRLRALLRPGED